jgi:mannitol 2-dehydrogenase
MKLNAENIAKIKADVTKPTYERSQLKEGIVHIGVGGFHRSHQAFYLESLLNQGGSLDWGICGVGLREEDRAMKNALLSQDCLYTLCELSEDKNAKVQIIGSIKSFLLAEDSKDKLIAKLAHPTTRIVSLTITEGGYCIDDSTGRFLADLPEITHDLQHPNSPKTIFGYLIAALKIRRDQGLNAFTIMSCDNLPHNGDIARKALLSFAKLQDEEMCQWISSHVSFPNSMVDRITPVTSKQHSQNLLDQNGILDAWPVVAEPFIQWIVEDNFVNGRPNLEEVGVQFTKDVTPFENMKIGLLNGGHQALAYLGALLGYTYTHETMQDDDLRHFVRSYMDEDVTPFLGSVPGINLDEYKNSLIERFSNEAICDQVSRICFDASSRLPKFIIPTLEKKIESGESLDQIALIIAAWCHYLQGKDEKGNVIVVEDPRIQRINKAAQLGDNRIERFLALDEVFGQAIPKSTRFIDALQRQLSLLENKGVRATLRLL